MFIMVDNITRRKTNMPAYGEDICTHLEKKT